MKTLADYRRDLHQIPELGFAEFKTLAYLLAQLTPLDCTLHTLKPTGLLAYFDCGREQVPTIGFRADMDGLPMVEETGLPFASTHPQTMHACGHDGHCAMLLGLANHLHTHRETVGVNVLLIFQPSEENEAGANVVLDSGYLARYAVQAIFGLHLWPGLSFGQVFTRAHELMAASSELDIVVSGKSTHIAHHPQSVDALAIATQLIERLYHFERQWLSDHYRLLRFGQLNAGTVRNAIASTAQLRGSLRSFYDETHQFLKQNIQSICDTLAQATGATIAINYNDGYEAVLNDPELVALLSHLPDLNPLKHPVMQAEDFGLYRKHCPILFSFLGVGDTPPLHAQDFDFEMSVLEHGLAYWIAVLTVCASEDGLAFFRGFDDE